MSIGFVVASYSKTAFADFAGTCKRATGTLAALNLPGCSLDPPVKRSEWLRPLHHTPPAGGLRSPLPEVDHPGCTAAWMTRFLPPLCRIIVCWQRNAPAPR